jgi:hypothetical protein
MKKITILFFVLSASILFAQTPQVGTKAWVEQQQRNSNPTVQDGSGSLGFLFDSTACGLNYAQASVKLGQRFSVACCPPVNGTVQPAPFPISTIPFCAQTVKAYLWCVVAGNGMPITATITDPVGNTQNFPMTMIGQDMDMCWGYTGTYTYRADVTSIVNGNGNYLISGLPVDPGAASHTNDVDGATLMIIYEDPTATYTGTLHMDDGCVVAPGGSLQHTMTGFTSCANSTSANSFMLIADLQGIGMDVSMNGGPNTPVVQEDWWNFVSSPTTLAQFQDSCDYFLNTSGSGDCYALALAGLYSQTTCATCIPAPNGLTITTTSVTTATCPGNGAATIAVTGGSGNYAITWNTIPVQTGFSASNLSGGIYAVNVVDSTAGICSAFSVTIPYNGPVPSVSTTALTCSSLGSATANVTGGIPPYSYSWLPTGGTASTAFNLPAGTYTVNVTDSTGCTVSAVDSVLNAAALVLGIITSDDNCGSPFGSATVSATGGQSPYTYLWQPGGDTTASVSNLAQGTYTVNVTDGSGCFVSSLVVINEGALTVNTSPFTIVSCGGPGQLLISANNPSATFSWQPATYLSNPNFQNQVVTPYTNITYTITVTTPCDTVTAMTHVIIDTVNHHNEPICMITVDTAIHKNVVVWERTNSPAHGSYNIYRETSPNVYGLIATQPVSQLTTYVDMNSTPTNYADRYRISTVDSCGFESVSSPHQRGVFLQLNYGTPAGYDLSWTGYEGLNVVIYKIYRGTTPSNLTYLVTAVGPSHTYTDANPPATGLLYMVEAVIPNGACIPSFPYTSMTGSHSNLAYTTMIGVNEYAENSFSISPNPTSSQLTIQIASLQPQPYSIYDLAGKLLQSGFTSGEKTIIDVQQLPAGMYFVQVGDEGKMRPQKFIKAE